MPTTWPVLPLSLGVIAAVFLGVLGAVVFRAVGKGVDGARSVGFTGVVLAFSAAHLLPGFVLGLGWCIARSDNFKDGAATPTKWKHFRRALKRMIAPALASVAAFLLGAEWAPLGVLVGITGYMALAAYYGDRNAEAKAAGLDLDPRLNVWVERGQGFVAAFSASIALSLSA